MQMKSCNTYSVHFGTVFKRQGRQPSHCSLQSLFCALHSAALPAGALLQPGNKRMRISHSTTSGQRVQDRAVRQPHCKARHEWPMHAALANLEMRPCNLLGLSSTQSVHPWIILATSWTMLCSVGLKGQLLSCYDPQHCSTLLYRVWHCQVAAHNLWLGANRHSC